MAFSVAIHPPKTPVTAGSRGMAKNTIPNVCKMPGPPAPFVPSPLPNIGKSELSPKGYSTTVTIEGQAVAIRGATFESMGDMASKGTGGGLISANTHGPTKFITPGSMNVKIEGKAVHQLGEPMLNNCGPSGSPPNTGATMSGEDQEDEQVDPPEGDELICGEMGTYGDQKKRTGKGKYHRDHIPSKAALKERAREIKKKLTGSGKLSTAQEKAIEDLATSVVIPAEAHRKVSPTYGGRNKDKIATDAKNPQAGAQRDTAEMKKNLDKYFENEDPACKEAYKKAADEIDKKTDEDYDNFIKKILNDPQYR